MIWFVVTLIALAWILLAACALLVVTGAAHADYYTDVVLRRREEETGVKAGVATIANTTLLHTHIYDSQIGAVRTVDGVILFCRCAEHKHFGPRVQIRGVH